MKAFHHTRSDESLRYHGTRLARIATAILSIILLVGLGSVAQANTGAGNHSPAGANLAVSGPSGFSSDSAQARLSAFAAPAGTYVGMTRSLQRQKIESIDPTSWLAQFGNVEREGHAPPR